MPTKPPSPVRSGHRRQPRPPVENAKVQLSYTMIRSPIDGRTGNLTVKLGNVVKANTMDMMTINQVQPIYVTFSVPEAQLNAIKKYMAMGTLTVRARPQDADAATKNAARSRLSTTAWIPPPAPSS